MKYEENAISKAIANSRDEAAMKTMRKKIILGDVLQQSSYIL